MTLGFYFGFSATPNRGDKVRLDDIFDDIIYQKDIRWGIENKYLSDIYCLRVDVGYDLSNVTTRMGDFAIGELGAEMNRENVIDEVAKAYEKYAKGQTLIFATSVEQAENISSKIPNSACITGKTSNRQSIIDDFTNRKIKCLVNCMIFTEGTDLPLVETVMIARPTQSDSLYTQMVGRGLRLYPRKRKFNFN